MLWGAVVAAVLRAVRAWAALMQDLAAAAAGLHGGMCCTAASLPCQSPCTVPLSQRIGCTGSVCPTAAAAYGAALAKCNRHLAAAGRCGTSSNAAEPVVELWGAASQLQGLINWRADAVLLLTRPQPILHRIATATAAASAVKVSGLPTHQLLLHLQWLHSCTCVRTFHAAPYSSPTPAAYGSAYACVLGGAGGLCRATQQHTNTMC